MFTSLGGTIRCTERNVGPITLARVRAAAAAWSNALGSPHRRSEHGGMVDHPEVARGRARTPIEAMKALYPLDFGFVQLATLHEAQHDSTRRTSPAN